MAIFSKGILGGFSGKVGNVIGSTWRGKDVLRSLPTKRNRVATQSQLDQQEKFSLIMKFMTSMTALLNTTFKAYGRGISAVNAAVSYNLQNGISGAASPFNLSYPNILLSRGDLPNTNTATAVAEAGNAVKFTWENNAGMGKAKVTDKVILVVYCPALNHTVYIAGGNMRGELTQSLTVAAFTGETVETWLAFIAANESVVSNSMYTGSVNIAP
ncbi:MAG TPA: DUF6266 family protein [Bacillota bacterium]|nr:DUF6266 family protein [Bacillota bacterium]